MPAGKKMKWSARHYLRASLVACALFGFGLASASAQIVNPSFESGDFSGWTQGGFLGEAPTGGAPNYITFASAQVTGTPQTPPPVFNGVVTAQTTTFDGFGISGPAVLPTDGSQLAFISNEKSTGSTNLTGSYLSQSFTVPVGVTTLSVDLMLLNNDATANFAKYNDFAGVVLLQNSNIVGQFNADLDPNSTASLHVTPGAANGGFKNSTPWTTASFHVAPYGGQTLTLIAYSLQYGNNAYETRLLLDNVRFNRIGVPTLSQWGLGLIFMLIAATGAYLVRRRVV
jgi:hypothetical protein